MSNELLFFLCGGVLAVSAVTVTFLGLRLKNFPGRALPIIVAWFVIFVGGATTFAVLHAQDEEAAEASELEHAGKEIEGAEHDEPKAVDEAEKEAGAGAATTLKLAASPTALAFDTTELEAQAGEVTIDFDNPSPIPHNVVIEEDGKELAGFEPIAEAEETVSADLKPGTYTFLCTVPGHAQEGMEGNLVVK